MSSTIRSWVALTVGLALGCFWGDAPLVGQEAATASNRTRNYAFLVACSDYDQKELKPLAFAQSDLLEFHQTLLESGFEKNNVVLMHDTQKRDYLPEGRKIREQLDLLLSRVGRNDTVVVALAGHGVQFKGDKRNYFCPLDARLKEPSSLIPLDELYKQLQECRAQRKLLLVDACRNDPQSSLGRSRAEVDLESVTRPQTEAVPEGIVALFSCSAGQQSFEHPELKHGIFFYHVLHGWRGAADSNADRKLTLDELVDYAKDKTQTYAHLKLNAKQIPQQKGDFSGVWSLREFLQAPLVVTPAGRWRINGLMPDGKPYGGSVDIQAHGSVYYMKWNVLYNGLGFLQDGHLFAGSCTSDQYGIVLYKIGRDGRLEGRWTTPDANGVVGSEIAVGGTPGVVEGNYSISGTRTIDGLAYRGALRISRNGGLYRLTWQVSEGSYSGVGMRSGDWLAVTWGRDGDSVNVIDYNFKENAAEGRWTFLGGTALGAENLVRVP